MSHVLRSVSVLAGLLLLAACGDSSAVSYRIPKETDEKPPVAAADPSAPANPSALPAGHPAIPGGGTGMDMANTPVATAEVPALRWSAPAHWHSKPAAGMRKATFTVDGDAGTSADLSVTAFPGDVGGELANVNRWRGQYQLPPVSAAELDSVVTHLDHDGLQIVIVDCSSSAGQRMLGAMVPYNGVIWFFKLTGPEALVAREKDAYLAFLGSLRTP